MPKRNESLLGDESASSVPASTSFELEREVLSHMAQGVYLVRASDGCIVHCNPPFEQMFGYSPGEMLGRPVSIVNAPTQDDPQ